MMTMMDEDQAIFENAGQAVHVAFLVMAQEAMQDAPLRMALIRIMESVKLDSMNQRHWLDQLKGTPSGNINFGGLAGNDIRAQCAMITQAVRTNLPPVEMWALQAKYGETDFEDVSDVTAAAGLALEALRVATCTADEKRLWRAAAQIELAEAREDLQQANTAGTALALALEREQAAREDLRAASSAVAFAERTVCGAQVKLDQIGKSSLVDNGPVGAAATGRRRFAFSAERIAAIKGLSDFFQPQFPRIKPLAMDCMLGRLYANHKKLDISTRDLATNFGGNYKMYLRAGYKLKNQLRIIEESAMERLRPIFMQHGVIADFH